METAPLPSHSHGRTFSVAIALLGIIASAEITLVAWKFIEQTRKPAVPSKIDVSHLPKAESEPTALNLDDTFTAAEAESEKPPAFAKPTPVAVKERASGASVMISDLISLAKNRRDAGDTASALLRLREATAMDPENVEAISELAMTFEKMNQAEKAFEQWRKIYDKGEAAGIYFSAAEAKLKAPTAAAPPAMTAMQRPAESAGPALPGIEEGKNLGVLEVAAADSNDAVAGRRVTLRIPIKKRPGLVINVQDVVIQVLFYDMLEDASVVQTNANVNSHWTTIPADWSDDDIEILEVEYTQPPPFEGQSKDKRNYFGYVARVYYQKNLQAWRAEPAKLRVQYPPPPILQTEDPNP